MKAGESVTKKEIALLAIEGLKKKYPEAICSLHYHTPYELLFATRLSAQCTDARVNIVTKELYSKYRSLQEIADADLADVEKIVKPCGLYKTKSKQIIVAAEMLLRDYDGVVPDTIDELLKLPGVGRKTANLVVGDVYGKPSIVTDTHCIRICNRLGIATGKDPYKVEIQLKKLLPAQESGDFCHRLVLFGREICKARKAECGVCPLSDFCRKKI
ncbi:MAG: nth [Oscillospiraceae bacterium]|nr:nth [Oscillospiraceae bacterium]